jgi:AraC-like DNA-binding protein
VGAPNLITRYARAVLQAAEAQGHGLAEVCRTAGVDPDAVGPEVGFIGADVFSRLSRTIKLALDDDFCGFTPSRCKSGSIRLVCESMVREDTLGEALRRAFRIFSYITRDLAFTLHEAGDIATVTLTLARPELDRFHYLHEWWLMLWPHVSSWLIGEETPVLCVDFPYEPSDPLDEYAAAFWGPCRFMRPLTQVQFPSRFLHRRIIQTQSDVEESFSNDQVDLVAVPGVHRSWNILIKAKLKECLIKTESMLSIEDLAREFNVSSKTLRRRLEDEGISFRHIKEEIRREVVLKWLSERDIPIGEVSLRAGFAERNGLVRAVRSWVGVSPKEYREMMIGGAPQPQPDSAVEQDSHD